MATIVNKSEFTISVNAEGVGTFTIPPGKSSDRLSDVQAKAWAENRTNKLIAKGLVLVRYDRNDPAKKKPESEVPFTRVERKQAEAKTVKSHADLAAMHWTAAAAAIGELEDLDLLAELHENETRQRVRDALEQRMKDLRNGEPMRNA